MLQKMETPLDYYGFFTILTCSDDEASSEALETMSEVLIEKYHFWRIDGYDLEPRSAASEAESGEVFEELVNIVQTLEEMGWQLYGRVFRCGESIKDIELYILSQEDGEVYRKRGFFEQID